MEGLGKIKDIAFLRLFQQSTYTISLFLGLIGGLKLFSISIALLFSFIITSSFFFIKFNKILKFIWKSIDIYKVNYRNEIFPYQWKIALSWVCGYFIFQLFNPVIFAVEGPVEAGKMGLTLAVLNGITALSLTWINTKVPLFSTLIVKKDFERLDLEFNKIVKQMLLVTFAMFFLLALIITFLRTGHYGISNRFIDTTSLVFLSLAAIFNIIINAMATYLRCHKKEPYLILSLIMGLLSALSTLTLGKYFGIKGISIGYFMVIGPISLTYATYIFLKKKIEWHQN